MTTELVKVDPAKRSVITCTVHADPWPTIAGWAQRTGYHPRDPQTGNVKLFQKGSGFWTAASRTQFTLVGSTLEIQAWLPISPIARLFALFLLPAEINLASGGFRAIIPRNLARKGVNELLAELGAPPIT